MLRPQCAFQHVEPLQTVDMPELLEHCAEVLEHGAQREAEAVKLARTQESDVPIYLCALLSRMDALDERRVCELLKVCAILPRALHFAAVHGAVLPQETVDGLSGFVTRLLQSEDYKTHKKDYLPTSPVTPPALPSSGMIGIPTDARVRASGHSPRRAREGVPCRAARSLRTRQPAQPLRLLLRTRCRRPSWCSSRSSSSKTRTQRRGASTERCCARQRRSRGCRGSRPTDKQLRADGVNVVEAALGVDRLGQWGSQARDSECGLWAAAARR
jgi:hypothetical protein